MIGALSMVATLFVVAIVLLVGNGQKGQIYDDLDVILSSRYGKGYKIIVFPPVKGRFLLAEEDLFIDPHERVDGVLYVKSGNATYGFRFLHEVDPDNVTVICAVKSEPPGAGWSKVVLKIPVSGTGLVENSVVEQRDVSEH